MAAADPPPRGTVRNPGSPSALRRLNQRRVVDALLAGGPATQAGLSRRTGLSTATVSNIVKDLLASGDAAVSPTTSSGRRALLVSLTPPSGLAIGMDFGRRHLRVLAATRGYEIVAEQEAELAAGYHPQQGLDRADELLAKVLVAAGAQRQDILGLGVGIPGPLDRRTGTAIGGTIHPEWVGIAVPELFRQRFGLPVFVDNDCNLGALAEVTWGSHRSVENLVFVKIGTGVGAGLILNGAPFYGSIGVTGELGHLTLDDRGQVCRCGNRGCLETFASTDVILHLLDGRTPGKLTTEAVVQMALGGDAATLRVIDDAGYSVGRALGLLANLINPEVIVVGGPLSGLGETLLAPVRRGLQRYAMPAVGNSTTVAMTELSEQAEALGAATLVIRSSVRP
ncbi:transcriptional regulator/sugar kinase [Arthrobacter crystallopoietes BAB-32]|uniref:Transcriptional regulator/sugar kinase n=1 Tax=Arthrobacter crystallopoietes BAB-32 TaxID=1246476 RepID=N1UX28_9MICC|nr:ROK family transcriptional regulator [Arthrobacter crystallopoietes]EMY32382.1 transcriptional regulator/sugar kinase [Arthrobacter crystallopoietes BAB-32]